MAEDEKKTAKIGRRVLLSGRFNEALTKQILESLFVLEAESPAEPITMVIDSYGGDLDSMFAIVDTMRGVSCAVKTVCVGKAMSAGLFVLIHGEPRKRLITPNARVWIHEIFDVTWGSTSDLELEVEEIRRMQDKMVEAFVRQTGQSERIVRKDMKETKYFDARAAVRYGFVDKIVKKGI